MKSSPWSQADPLETQLGLRDLESQEDIPDSTLCAWLCEPKKVSSSMLHMEEWFWLDNGMLECVDLHFWFHVEIDSTGQQLIWLDGGENIEKMASKQHISRSMEENHFYRLYLWEGCLILTSLCSVRIILWDHFPCRIIYPSPWKPVETDNPVCVEMGINFKCSYS